MSQKQRIVLCVDDDPDDLLFLIETIKEIDPLLGVASAMNGEEALRFLEHAKEDDKGMPCLVILDINMPVLDGKQALSRIKTDPAFDEVLVVLFTTSSSPIDKAFADKYGVPFITKSNNIKDFKEVVKKLLQKVEDC